jgi:hypothetical protein
MRKCFEKGEETANKANGIQDTKKISMCEYMSCRRKQEKPHSP